MALVGRGGTNHFRDLTKVQTLLNECLHLMNARVELDPDGVVRANTVAAIEAFQRDGWRSIIPAS